MPGPLLRTLSAVLSPTKPRCLKFISHRLGIGFCRVRWNRVCDHEPDVQLNCRSDSGGRSPQREGPRWCARCALHELRRPLLELPWSHCNGTCTTTVPTDVNSTYPTAVGDTPPYSFSTSYTLRPDGYSGRLPNYPLPCRLAQMGVGCIRNASSAGGRKGNCSLSSRENPGWLVCSVQSSVRGVILCIPWSSSLPQPR